MRCGSVLAGAVCALARQANVLSAGLLDLRVPYLTPHPPPPLSLYRPRGKRPGLHPALCSSSYEQPKI